MDNKTQITNIASVIQHYKRVNGLTVEQIINKLPPEYQMSRTGFNAYLHGSINNPPSRDFFFAILKAVDVPNIEYDYVLNMCGFAPVNNSLRDIVLLYAAQQNILLTQIDLDFATSLLDDVLIDILRTIYKARTASPAPFPSIPQLNPFPSNSSHLVSSVIGNKPAYPQIPNFGPIFPFPPQFQPPSTKK